MKHGSNGEALYEWEDVLHLPTYEQRIWRFIKSYAFHVPEAGELTDEQLRVREVIFRTSTPVDGYTDGRVDEFIGRYT